MLEQRKDREEWEKKNPKDRKYIDYTLRRYIEKQFKSLEHLLKVLEILPDDQIKSVLTPQNMADLLKVAERAMEILPPVIIEGEEGQYQTNRSYDVNFGSKLVGSLEASAWVHVTCPASEAEIEYWKMFIFYKDYLLDHIFKDLNEHPPTCSLKELNQEIVPELNKIAAQRGVFCKIEPVKTITGKPNEEWKEKSQHQFKQADELLNPKKKEEPK